MSLLPYIHALIGAFRPWESKKRKRKTSLMIVMLFPFQVLIWRKKMSDTYDSLNTFWSLKLKKGQLSCYAKQKNAWLLN